MTADEADTYLAILGNKQNTSGSTVVKSPLYETVKQKYNDKYELDTSFSFALTMTQVQEA